MTCYVTFVIPVLHLQTPHSRPSSTKDQSKKRTTAGSGALAIFKKKICYNRKQAISSYLHWRASFYIKTISSFHQESLNSLDISFHFSLEGKFRALIGCIKT